MNAGRIPLATVPSPRRRLRRRLVLLLIAAALPLLGVATLPWWFPTGWLRNIIAVQLTQLCRRDVHVGRATLDWSDGVEIHDIHIADDATRGGRLLELDAVRCGLTPWRWLRGRGLDRLELIKPTLYVQFDANGRVNLAALPAPAPGGPMATRLVFRDATVQLAGPKPGVEPVIRIGDMTLVLDSSGGVRQAVLLNGSVHRDARSEESQGTWSARAELHVAATRATAGNTARDAVPFLGDVTVEWSDLDLTCLPLAWRTDLAGHGLEGRGSGSLRVSLRDDLNHTFTARMDGRHMGLRVGNEPIRRLEQASITAEGVWRSTLDVVSLSSWRVKLPWMEAESAGGAESVSLELAMRSETPLVAHGRGRVTDAAELCRELGVDASVEASGAIGFDVTLDIARTRRSAVLRLTGDSLRLHVVDVFDLPRGCPVDVAMKVEADEPLKSLHAERLDVRVGTVRMTGHFDYLLAEPFRTELHLEMEVPHMEELRERVPRLGLLEDVELAGELRGRLDANSPDLRHMSFGIETDRNAVVHVGQWLNKTKGRPLHLGGIARLSEGDDKRLEDIIASAQYGSARAGIDKGEACFRRSGETISGNGAGDFSISGAEAWLSLSPLLQEHFVNVLGGDADIAGDLAGHVDLALEAATNSQDGHITLSRAGARVELDATGLDVQPADLLCKPAAVPALLSATALWEGESSSGELWIDGGAQLGANSIAWRARRQAEEWEAKAWVDASDLMALREAIPRLNSTASNVRVEGGMKAAMSARLGEREQNVALDLDVTPANVRLVSADGAVVFAKPAETPLRARLDAGCMRGDDEGVTLRFNPSRVESGQSLIAWIGEARLNIATMDGPFHWEDIDRLDLNGTAWIDMESAATLFGDEAEQLLAQHDVHGSLAGTFGMHVDADRLEFQGYGDAGAASGRWPGAATKRIGQPLWIEAQAMWPRADFLDAGGRVDWRTGVNAAEASGDAWRVAVVGRGLTGNDSEGLHATAVVGVDDARRLGELLEWRGVELRGGKLHGLAEFYGDTRGLRLDRARWVFDDFAMGVQGRPESLQFDGGVDATGGSIRSDGLSLQMGRSDATVTGELRANGADMADGVSGEIALAAHQVDMGELPELLEHWRKELGLPEPVPVPVGEEKISSGVRRFALGSDIRVNARISDALIPTLAGAGPFHAKELAISPSLVRGRLHLPFDCSVNGGVVTGAVTTTLNEENPHFDLVYAARRLSCEPNTRPLVEAFFPGLIVTGPITLIDATHQRMYDRPGVANAAVGTGEMILEGGTVVGRAAPLVISRLFPGLNLARFEYTRMENRFEKDAAGHMHNHMVFFGRYYDMYVDGVSYAEGRLRYEVGVDLYASLLPNLSRAGQGRIALFIKTGMKGPGNTMLDETVWYLRPDQIMAKILSDNLLTQTYHALKRAMGRGA